MRTERNNPNPGADAHWSDDRMLERLYGLDPPPGWTDPIWIPARNALPAGRRCRLPAPR